MRGVRFLWRGFLDLAPLCSTTTLIEIESDTIALQFSSWDTSYLVGCIDEAEDEAKKKDGHDANS